MRITRQVQPHTHIIHMIHRPRLYVDVGFGLRTARSEILSRRLSGHVDVVVRVRRRRWAPSATKGQFRAPAPAENSVRRNYTSLDDQTRHYPPHYNM